MIRAGAVLLLLTGGFLAPAQADCLTIGIGTGGAYAKERAVLVERIFERAQLCAKPLLVPARRLASMELRGELDGTAWRDDAYLGTHKGEVKVPTPVEQFSGSLFWLRGHPDPAGMDGSTIGILAGRVWPREALKGLPVAIFEANDYAQLFRLTASGRLSGFVMPTSHFGKLELNQSLYQSKVIRTVPLYLVLQARNKGDIPALDKAIKEMESSGAIK